MPSHGGAKGKRENNIVIHNVIVHYILTFENIALALFVWIEFLDVPLNFVCELPYLCPLVPALLRTLAARESYK